MSLRPFALAVFASLILAAPASAVVGGEKVAAGDVPWFAMVGGCGGTSQQTASDVSQGPGHGADEGSLYRTQNLTKALDTMKSKLLSERSRPAVCAGRDSRYGAAVRECEEIRVFEGVAERTGKSATFRSAKNYPACTSFRDLVRKYNLHGDGLFYLAGPWPSAERLIVLDNVKWRGAEAAMKRR